jgi:hypothetical protein
LPQRPTPEIGSLAPPPTPLPARDPPLRLVNGNPPEHVFAPYSHAAVLHERSTPEGERHIAVDGKALRLSFDNFCDRKAAHILSAFTSDPALVLAHLDCDEKSNEIRAVQALLRQLGRASSADRRCHALSKKPSRRPVPS